MFTYYISLIFLNQVHFVNQAENFCLMWILQNCFQTTLVVMHISVKFSTFNIENIDKDLHIPEDIVPLAGKIVFHECFLTDNDNNTNERYKNCSQNWRHTRYTLEWQDISEWISTIIKDDNLIVQAWNVTVNKIWLHCHSKWTTD